MQTRPEKDYAFPETEVIKGLHQVVGHTRTKKSAGIVQPITRGNILYSDTMQSIGYRQNVSGATLIHINKNRAKVESAIITPQNITAIIQQLNQQFLVSIIDIQKELDLEAKAKAKSEEPTTKRLCLRY